MKRFYTNVAIDAQGGVLLDGRPVKTPARAPLILPNTALAEAVADEWRGQGEDIDPRTMPITGLANAAIDRVTPDPAGFAAPLAAYAESELLCYRADHPPELVARQGAMWAPILSWAEARYDVRFTRVTGIMHQAQPPETLSRLARALQAYPPIELAAFNPMVTISGSLVLALAIADDHLDPERAFDAAHLDELWQAEHWGEDDLALETRAARRRDFLSACRFLRLCRDSR